MLFSVEISDLYSARFIAPFEEYELGREV